LAATPPKRASLHAPQRPRVTWFVVIPIVVSIVGQFVVILVVAIFGIIVVVVTYAVQGHSKVVIIVLVLIVPFVTPPADCIAIVKITLAFVMLPGGTIHGGSHITIIFAPAWLQLEVASIYPTNQVKEREPLVLTCSLKVVPFKRSHRALLTFFELHTFWNPRLVQKLNWRLEPFDKRKQLAVLFSKRA
jgi:hypothetical protein